MNTYRMALGVLFVGALVVTAARAEDPKTKLVGVWEVTKGETLPKGSTVEFTKDDKIEVIVKDDKGKTVSIKGTYKADGEKLMVTLKDGEKEHKETMTIKKLTDKEFVTADEKGKTDEFMRKAAK